MTQDLMRPESGREVLTSLAAVPPEAEWFANLDNPRTRRAYEQDIQDFMTCIGIARPEAFRLVTRAHVLFWRKDLESRKLAKASIRRKLSALSSLFDYLCECHAVTHNPVDGVKRPKVGSQEGLTPALNAAQARVLLEAPDPTTLKGQRDRAMLATFLYHGLRESELCGLKVKDTRQQREGIAHLRIHGKGDKIRFVPIAPKAQRLIHEYLAAAGHSDDLNGALFRPVRNHRTGVLNKALAPEAVLRIVKAYGQTTGISAQVHGFCVHSLRATAATNALEHDADLAKVQQWLGHANIATTRLYDRRHLKAEDSPTFKVVY